MPDSEGLCLLPDPCNTNHHHHGGSSYSSDIAAIFEDLNIYQVLHKDFFFFGKHSLSHLILQTTQCSIFLLSALNREGDGGLDLHKVN